MWAGISGCVCVCAHTQEKMCEVEWMYVHMFMVSVCVCVCVSRPSPLGESRVEPGGSSVQWSDAFPVQQRRHGLSSQLDHRHVFRWARRSGVALGFYGQPQQGLNVCGSVSHSVSHSLTQQFALQALVEDTAEDWQVRQSHHLTHQRAAAEH